MARLVSRAADYFFRDMLPETKLLLLICAGDLCVTLWLFNRAGYDCSAELNPLMRYFLILLGPIGLLAAKAVFTIPPIIVIEWYRTRDARFAARVLRVAIGAYLAIMTIGILIPFLDVLV